MYTRNDIVELLNNMEIPYELVDHPNENTCTIYLNVNEHEFDEIGFRSKKKKSNSTQQYSSKWK